MSCGTICYWSFHSLQPLQSRHISAKATLFFLGPFARTIVGQSVECKRNSSFRKEWHRMRALNADKHRIYLWDFFFCKVWSLDLPLTLHESARSNAESYLAIVYCNHSCYMAYVSDSRSCIALPSKILLVQPVFSPAATGVIFFSMQLLIVSSIFWYMHFC